MVLGLHDARQPVARREHHGERRGHQADQRLDALARAGLGGRQRCHGPPILRSGRIRGWAVSHALRVLFPPCRPTSLPGSAVSAGSPPWRRWCPGSPCTRAVLWAQLAYSDAPDNKADRLRYFDRHAGEILASAVVQAVGMLLLAVVALHLYRAVKARRPDEPLVVAVMGVYGPVGMALITVAQAVALTIIAGDFADRPSQTLAAAEDALRTRPC